MLLSPNRHILAPLLSLSFHVRFSFLDLCLFMYRFCLNRPSFHYCLWASLIIFVCFFVVSWLLRLYVPIVMPFVRLSLCFLQVSAYQNSLFLHKVQFNSISRNFTDWKFGHGTSWLLSFLCEWWIFFLKHCYSFSETSVIINLSVGDHTLYFLFKITVVYVLILFLFFFFFLGWNVSPLR